MKKILILLIIISSSSSFCSSNYKFNLVKSRLTNDSIKYWYQTDRKGNDVNNEAIIWMFNVENDFFEFILNKENGKLRKRDYDDVIYENKYKYIDFKSLTIDNTKFDILLLTDDSLIVYSKSQNLKRVFISYSLRRGLPPPTPQPNL